MNKGAAVSIHGRFGGLLGVGIASSYDKELPSSATLRKIDLLTRQFHYVYSIHNDQIKDRKEIQLTIREREVLLWMCEGKSNTVIADLLYIQHTTVRYHIKNIYLKLGVINRIMAVVKALKLELICPTFVQTPYQG